MSLLGVPVVAKGTPFAMRRTLPSAVYCRKTHPFCNNRNDKKRTFSHVPIEAR